MITSLWSLKFQLVSPLSGIITLVHSLNGFHKNYETPIRKNLYKIFVFILALKTKYILQFEIKHCQHDKSQYIQILFNTILFSSFYSWILREKVKIIFLVQLEKILFLLFCTKLGYRLEIWTFQKTDKSSLNQPIFCKI